MECFKQAFDFHGISVSIHCNKQDILNRLSFDFSYFRTIDEKNFKPVRQIAIRAIAEKFPEELLPNASTKMMLPRCHVYNSQGKRYVNYYHGEALSIFDYSQESGEVWSEDLDLLHEIVYLMILSRVGSALETKRHIIRTHAAGLSVAGKGILLMLPTGNGKSSLTVKALDLPGVRILSDDTPLLDLRAQMLAFPVRLGFKDPTAVYGFSSEHVMRFDRREHGLKWLVSTEAISDKIVHQVAPKFLIIGQRWLNQTTPRLTPVNKLAAAYELMRSVVVGVGLPQIVEYFLKLDYRDWIQGIRLFALRSFICARLLMRVQVLRFDLTSCEKTNTAFFQAFLAAAAKDDFLWAIDKPADSFATAKQQAEATT